MAEEEKKDDDYQIIDEETFEFGNKGEIDIKKLVTAHINRLSEFTFKGSISQGKSDKHGQSSTSGITNTLDRREIFIDAVEFLVGLVQPYYDTEMSTLQEGIYEKITALEEKFLSVSIEKEAYSRASSAKFDNKNVYLFWLTELKKQDFSLYDRDSPEYENYLYSKHRYMMEIFKEINLLLFRKDYLATETEGIE